MKLNTRHLLLVACCVAGSVSTTHAGENCTLTIPPRAAAVNANHGEFLFIYPRKVEKDYSGCQTMWNQRGAPVFVLRFEQGELASYQEFAKSSRKAALSCRYVGTKLKTRSSKCPAYEDVEAGFRTMPEADEPQVPPEADPRRN